MIKMRSLLKEVENPLIAKLEKFKTVVLRKFPNLKFQGYENSIGSYDETPEQNPYRIAFSYKSERFETVKIHRSFQNVSVYSTILGLNWTDVNARDAKECLDIIGRVYKLLENGKRIKSKSEFQKLVGNPF